MRPSSWLNLAMTLAVVASLPACNCQRRDPAIETPIAELQGCEENERCETGLCDSANGNPRVCLRTCTQGCRGSDICTRLESGSYACVPEKAGLCKTCQTDSDCPQAADKCLLLGDTRYCGRDCSFDDACPPSFRCGEATTVDGALAPKQCQPTSGTCECIAATAGQQVPCEVTNASGTCSGISVCRPPVGYDVCSARTPTGEVCNGIDDDCNGMTDENLGDATCGTGDCVRSVAACANGTTQVCTPGMPNAETCNNRDDNCNGTVDDGFNTQTDVVNCGTCDTVCVLTNAVPKCELGACGVERCVAGWSDLDRVAANGCEYPCVSDGGMEICDGLDNDCDGTVDDGFDLINDPSNCGQCNLICSVTGTTVSTYACVARVCGIGSCVPGRGNCNQQYGDGCEVDLATEVTHCGACGQACTTANATPACDGGMCGIASCNTGFGNCNGQVGDGCEVNTQTALANCGVCGNVCNAANANNTCVNGTCGFTCAANWWDADGLASNGCEYACIRTAGGVEQCDNIDNDCDNRVDEDFDLTSNGSHCGQCNRACSAPFATTTCSSSACAVTACDTSRANCNNAYVDGCEVNTGTDLANCGGCNNTCATANATPRCQAGSCGIQSCNPGFDNCNNQVSDGCEVNTNTSLTNCGACNNTCSAANGTPSCVGGTCGVLSCNPSFANCNNQASDGCEVNTGTSLNNCGACNVACATANGTPSCSAGACGISSCNPGFTNCNGTVADGCEVNTGGSDLANCGGCGTVCSTANATPQCTTGSCGISSCNLGFANCNSQANDGCEINITNNLANCGGCGVQCAPANAAPVCAAGTCSIGACQAGWVNLNGLVADGCEYACVPSNGGLEACDGLDNNCNGSIDEGFTLATDVNNCGGCGTVCSAPNVTVPRCVTGSCGVLQCATGFANCNGGFSDGCEVNTTNSLAHCGACANACNLPNANPVCTASTCQVDSCIGTNRNCNSLPVDGCEVDIATNVNNCGGCGTQCSTPDAVNTCTSGSCGYTCPANRWDNDGNTANGCEYVCTFLSSTDEPDLNLVDANCDGIDGELGNSVFVAPFASGGNDSNPGTRTAPKATISAGVSTATTSGKRDVLVAQGTYLEQVLINTPNKGVFGGYTVGTWARSLATSVTVTGVNTPLRISNANNTVVQAINFIGANAVGVSQPAYAGLVTNSNSVRLERLTLQAGNGSAGTSGGAGSNGASGLAGGRGNPGCEESGGLCAGCSAPAVGAGGFSSCGRTGGNGGAAGRSNVAGSPGQPGVVGTAGGPGTPHSGGDWNTPLVYWGSNGTSGGAGSNGSSGLDFGTLSAIGYTVAATSPGASGAHGNGGGGGGGGGGGDSGCDSYGGSGSGGGGGGCLGTGGANGTSGGGSFGLMLWASTAQATNCTVTSATGGNGGNGGAGGAGGSGGTGGPRNAYGGGGEQDDGSNGGPGGNGGNGGSGGAGGAGGGGPSVGVVRGGGSVWSATGSSVTAGSGGFGGFSNAGSGQMGLVTTVY